MATFDKDITKQYGSLEAFAEADGCSRIYESDSGYHTVRKPADEEGILSSPYLHNLRLVWERGRGLLPEESAEERSSGAMTSEDIGKLLQEPKAAICSACGKVAKPNDKRVAIVKAVASLAFGAVLIWVSIRLSFLPLLEGEWTGADYALIIFLYFVAAIWPAASELRMAWNRTCPNCRKGTLTPLSASERQQLLFQANEQPYSKSGLYEIGVLFDIDELGGGFYGWEAYKIFFNSLDPKRLTGCTLLDGDTKETLAGRANQYCIAVQSLDPSKLDYVKETLSQQTAKGLLPPGKRFIEGKVTAQHPLALAGEIDSNGNLIVKQNSMIGEGWVKGTAWTVIKR